MKLFFTYLSGLRHCLLWAVLCSVCFAGVFAFRRADMRLVWYPLLLCGVLSAGFLLTGFFHFSRKHRKLVRLLQTSGPVGDELPEAVSILEKDYRDVVLHLEEEYRDERKKWEEARLDMENYYATWVHQIKAPIAVMQVLLQQEDTEKNHELRAELFRISQYVEMALCYIRLDEGVSDLVIQEYSLDDIIRKAIRKYAGQFIRSKIRLEYSGTDQNVLTDEKWLSFIIEQLLSNAVKYTRQGTVSISVSPDRKLAVSDTGIGIAPEDQPRIFEKGYTGYNGRGNKKSTGLGLYLSLRAAKRLGHKLSVQSVPGQGSTFTVDLNCYPFHPE